MVKRQIPSVRQKLREVRSLIRRTSSSGTLELSCITMGVPGRSFWISRMTSKCRLCLPRYRNDEMISTAFVESTVNQVINKRMVKKQQMQWTPRGEHLLLQTRTKVITMNSRRYFADGIRGSAQRPDPRPLGGLSKCPFWQFPSEKLLQEAILKAAYKFLHVYCLYPK